MKSASVFLPGSGENLQITPYGLLKAINTVANSRSGDRALDEIRRHGGARHPLGGAFATMVSPAATPARARFEPLAHVGIQADAEHVVIERLAQAHAEKVM